jgi:hypothetical protein
MRPVRLLALVLLLAVASCGVTQGVAMQSGSPLIDQPRAPFPYNSRFCP